MLCIPSSDHGAPLTQPNIWTQSQISIMFIFKSIEKNKLRCFIDPMGHWGCLGGFRSHGVSDSRLVCVWEDPRGWCPGLSCVSWGERTGLFKTESSHFAKCSKTREV